MAISVGSVAPDFELPSNELLDNGRPGKPVKLSDFRGKKHVVLAFYPLDFSPTCSSEHACFVNDLSSLEAGDAQVLGISVDSVWSHLAYAKHSGIRYPLLADFHPKGAAAEKFGLFLADKGFTSRATVIIDKHGKVAWVKEQPLGEARDNKEILAVLKGL